MEAPKTAAAFPREGIFQASAHRMSEEGEGRAAVDGRKGRPIRQIGSKKRTFDRRRNRLFKAASELSTLCDAEVAAIVFSPSGKVSEFASSSTSHTIRRYQSFQPQTPWSNVLSQDVKMWNHEADLLDNKSKYLEEFQRYVLEKNMLMSISEAKSGEIMLMDALRKIQNRKLDLLKVEAQKIMEKGEAICKGNNGLQLKLTQILSTTECLWNASSEWLDILQGTQDKEDSNLSKT